MSTKVMTIVGTRPEIIKLSRVIAELDKNVEHILVHTGQNYDFELNEIFFKDLDVRKPDYFLNSVGKTTAETIGNILIRSDEIFEKVNPDAVLLYGDTNSCLSVISAKRRQIPIFHMEAGNRCFDQRVPEELNRKIVDHLSDINMPLTEQARDYLISEGIRPETVIKTGSCMKEILSFYKDKIDKCDVLERLNLVFSKYFIVSIHREENVDSEVQFSKWVETLNAIADKFQLPIIVSAHPRTQNQIDSRKPQLAPLIRLIKPLNFTDYNKLQICSKAVLSDSGTINEESSILCFPALNIRESHERPEAMEETSVMMLGLDIQSVMQALGMLENQANNQVRHLHTPLDYTIDNVSEKIARIIMSYTGYVNRVVWKKY
jgi:UDP-N-acetylglucosamine 2-epimerase (non-hydrolysing)